MAKTYNLSGKRWWLYANPDGLRVKHQIYVDGEFIRADDYNISWDFIEQLKEKHSKS